jgi:hypothetical protein
MSDVGLNFSALDFFLYGSIVALPVTTILLALLIWRRIAAGAGRPVLNAGIAVLGVLWVVPAGLVAVLWVDGLVVRHSGISRSRPSAGSMGSCCRPNRK